MLCLPHDEVGNLVPRCIRRCPALGHVLRHFGILLVELSQNIPVVVRCVAMPCDVVDIVTGAVQNGLWVFRHIYDEISKIFPEMEF